MSRDHKGISDHRQLQCLFNSCRRDHLSSELQPFCEGHRVPWHNHIFAQLTESSNFPCGILKYITLWSKFTWNNCLGSPNVSMLIMTACEISQMWHIGLVGKGEIYVDSDGLVQERRNSIANALELRLFCTNPNALELRLSCTNLST